MKKISNRSTFVLKWVFPFFFYGILAFIVVVLLQNGALKKAPFFLAVPCVMGLIAYSFIQTTRGLADEVYDCGDFLLVRKNNEEDNVALSNIIHVEFVYYKTLPRIILTLDVPGKFGREVVFATPPQFLFRFNITNKIAEDLKVRVHQARSTSAVESPDMDPAPVAQ